MGARKRGASAQRPRALPRPPPVSALSLLRARGCPAPQTSLPPPPALVGSELRARRAPPASPAPWTAHPAAPGTAPGIASRSHSPPAALFFPGVILPPCIPRPLCLGGLRWGAGRKLSPLPRPRSVLLLLFVTVPLTRGTQTPWTGLPRCEHVLPAEHEARAALGSGTRRLPGCRARTPGTGLPPPLVLPIYRDSTRARLPRTRPLPDHPCPPPARPPPPHRLDTRGSRVLIG